MKQSGPPTFSGGFRCPICKKAIANVQEPAFPFCSDKCRLLDLGNWLDGKYTTSRPLDPSDEQTDQQSIEQADQQATEQAGEDVRFRRNPENPDRS